MYFGGTRCSGARGGIPLTSNRQSYRGGRGPPRRRVVTGYADCRLKAGSRQALMPAGCQARAGSRQASAPAGNNIGAGSRQAQVHTGAEKEIGAGSRQAQVHAGEWRSSTPRLKHGSSAARLKCSRLKSAQVRLAGTEARLKGGSNACERGRSIGSAQVELTPPVRCKKSNTSGCITFPQSNT